MNYRRFILTEKPHLEDAFGRLSGEAWPEFLLHGDTHNWGSLFNTFSDYQFLLLDNSEEVIGLGHTVPLRWDGSLKDLPETISEIIERALRAQEHPGTANTFSALAAIVSKEYLGKGVSALILHEMKALAEASGCGALIAPVRPTWKSRYPLAPMERYVQWRRQDGAPFDPWIRVHWRLGAENLKVAPNALTVTGTVAQWEAWTGMPFPESGEYIVPGALQPVTIDRDRDIGYYEDPNFWMKHPI